MAKSQYNQIYKKLVRDNSDAVGMFAYALYKQQKIAFVEKIATENGHDPTDEELASFHTMSMLEPTITGYRDQGEALVAAFLNESLTQRVLTIQKGVEDSVIGDYLKNIKEQIASKRTVHGWLADVASKLTVSVVTILMIGMLIMGYKGIGELSHKAEAAAGLTNETNK